jgi:hypothetical protein
MAPVLKTGIPERVSGVRIPPSPPYSLKCREICLDCPGNNNKSPQFCGFSLTNRTGESVLLHTVGELCRLSLRRADWQSGFDGIY